MGKVALAMNTPSIEVLSEKELRVSQAEKRLRRFLLEDAALHGVPNEVAFQLATIRRFMKE